MSMARIFNSDGVINENQLRGEIGDSPSSFSISSEGNVTLGVGRISSSAIADSDFIRRSSTVPISYPFNFSGSLQSQESLNEGSLAFLEMKIENKDDHVIVTMIYIDKETYEEVTRTYRCNVSISKEYRFTIDSSGDAEDLTINLSGMRTFEETRKQL